MTDRARLPAGIYLSPRHDDMVVMVDAGGFPRPVSEDYNTLISHNGQPDRLAKLWGPLTPAKVVPADAIVIDRTDLPAMDFTTAAELLRINTVDNSISRLRATGLSLLAAAEYLNAHPPIDEAAVYALGLVCIAEGVADPHRTARRLVAAGVRAPQAGDDQ